MTLALSEHLPLIASASDGIQKLRELILELAVRGKLVPQDPNDEPASELLKRIKQERKQLEAEGVCKKSKATLVDECNWPFELPTGWKWCRFPDVANYKMGKTPPTKESVYWAEGGIPWVSISDMDHGQRIVTTTRTVSNAACAKVFRSDPVPAGTLLMSFKLTVGKVSTLGIDAFHNEAIISIFPFKGISQEYLSHFLPMIAQGGNSKSALMGDTLNSESLALLCIPLPPTAEQNRIVAKVDELMALCDRLESEQNDSAAAHAQLVETLLATLTQSTDAADFEANWKRIAEHFDTLFTTDASIDALRKNILQLALMGKLVPQDHNDEPASELLKRIRMESAAEDARGRVRKVKSLSPVSDMKKPFEAPEAWEWIRLQEIINVSSGDGLTSERMAGVGNIPVFGGNGVTGQHNQANIDKPTLVIGRVGFYCGSIHLTPPKAWVTDNALKVRFSEKNLSIEFLFWLLSTTNLKGNESATAQPLVSGKTIYPIVVALPPLLEQQRIVAKVDELMAVCDQLKASIKAATSAQSTLSAVLIQQALEAA